MAQAERKHKLYEPDIHIADVIANDDNRSAYPTKFSRPSTRGHPNKNTAGLNRSNVPPRSHVTGQRCTHRG